MFSLKNRSEGPQQGVSVGILIMDGVANKSDHHGLDKKRLEIEADIRDKYGEMSRKALKTVHPMSVYVDYYKGFGHSYHVLLQLESVIKGKDIPSISPLVTSMFMAELKNMILTAGHDVDRISMPLELKVLGGDEKYTGINGKEITAVRGDMAIFDQEGIISSILKGPDLRTMVKHKTERVIFTAYAPSGIEDDLIYGHLSDIEAYVCLFSEKAKTELKQVYR